MSRYNKQISEKISVAYGYDRPMQSYFFQKYDTNQPEDEELIIDECSLLTKMSNGRMMELMIKHECLQEHIDCVMNDLPIPEYNN